MERDMSSIVFTAKDIFEQDFGREVRGYSKVEVDEFLDDIATGKFPAIFCDFKKGYGYYIKNDFEQETNRKVNEGITEIYTRIRIGGKVLRPNAFKPLKVK